MLAVCFQDVGKVETLEVADPQIERPTDAIVEVQLAGLCGSDLHPFHGREQGLDPGTVMGHEMVGRVVAVGEEVRCVKTGDQVFAPFTTSCGFCFYCKRGLSSRCQRGQLFGWRTEGKGLHGCQAQLARVPLADGTLRKLTERTTPEAALLLGDNLTTGYYCAKMAGITSEGCYVVLGCGTVGSLAALAAVKLGAQQLFAFDPNSERAAAVGQLGVPAYSDPDELRDSVLRCTEGRGADAVMELVGLRSAQQLAYELLRPGGTLSLVGCNCEPNFCFSPAAAYDKNLTVKTGRCPVSSLLGEVESLFAEDYPTLGSRVTHRFSIDEATEAYDVFANRKDGCQKAVFQF